MERTQWIFQSHTFKSKIESYCFITEWLENFLVTIAGVAQTWTPDSFVESTVKSIQDKVGNTKSYNFVEYVRFDTIESDITLDTPLEIEILDKVINAGNVDSIKVKMSCVPCSGLNYVATIYSRYGGGAVVRNEGTLTADEVIIENMNTAGILDGEVNLTVQLTDAEDKLVATKTTAYTKDVVYPKAYYTRSNLQKILFFRDLKCRLFFFWIFTNYIIILRNPFTIKCSLI
mgnify:CR=1 FL=1